MNYKNASKAKLALFALLLLSWHWGARQLPPLGAEDARLLGAAWQSWGSAAAEEQPG